MIESIGEFEASLRGLLAAAASRNRVNALDVPGLRRSLVDTHREMEAEERERGTASAGVYWELVMADWSADEDALFAVAAWRADTFSIYAGAGRRVAILGVCDRFSMAEVEELISAMEGEFGISRGELRIPRGMAEYWVAAEG